MGLWEAQFISAASTTATGSPVSNTFLLPWTTLSVLPDSHLHGTLRHTLSRPWQELSSHVLAQLEVATDHLKIRGVGTAVAGYSTS